MCVCVYQSVCERVSVCVCVCVCFYNPIKVSDNLITGSSKAAQSAHALNVAKRTTKKVMKRERREGGKWKKERRERQRVAREQRK